MVSTDQSGDVEALARRVHDFVTDNLEGAWLVLVVSDYRPYSTPAFADYSACHVDRRNAENRRMLVRAVKVHV